MGIWWVIALCAVIICLLAKWCGTYGRSTGDIIRTLKLKMKQLLRCEISCRIMVFGLDNSGKTTVIHMLRNGIVRAHPPTTHYSPWECIELDGDGGNGDGGRTGWWCCRRRRPYKMYLYDVFQSRNYDAIHRCDGLIYMVDAADRHRLDESRTELYRLLNTFQHTRTRDGIRISPPSPPIPTGFPVLILANKVDRPEALTMDELCRAFQLPLRAPKQLIEHHYRQVKRCLDQSLVTINVLPSVLSSLIFEYAADDEDILYHDTRQQLVAALPIQNWFTLPLDLASPAASSPSTTATSSSVAGGAAAAAAVSDNMSVVNIMLRVQPCSVVRRAGVADGLRWLGQHCCYTLPSLSSSLLSPTSPIWLHSAQNNNNNSSSKMALSKKSR